MTAYPRARSGAGDVIGVTREFRVIRDDRVYLVRTMTKGSCPVACDIVDLHGGWVEVIKGDYRRTRDIVIPATIRPGIWTLAFHQQWEDSFGRRYSRPLPTMEIEVTP